MKTIEITPDDLGKLLTQAAAEGLRIGKAGTDGSFTAEGIAGTVYLDSGMTPVERTRAGSGVKARILVATVRDYETYTTMHAIADENVLDQNPDWLHVEQVASLKEMYAGDLLGAYGFIDVEIPDKTIKAVLRTSADAGTVAATSAAPEGGN